jgi:hypothetical protein
MSRDKAKQAAYMREWSAKNRERVRAAQRARRAAENPEKRKAVQNAWYAKNRIKLGEKARKRYREETGDLVRARTREWAMNNPDRKKAADQKYYRNKRLENILWLARRRAEKNGYAFSITREHIVVPALCPYLGVPFADQGDYVPTIDRIKPELGYVPSNILVVTKRANRIKNNATWVELLKIGNALKQLSAN